MDEGAACSAMMVEPSVGGFVGRRPGSRSGAVGTRRRVAEWSARRAPVGSLLGTPGRTQVRSLAAAVTFFACCLFSRSELAPAWPGDVRGPCSAASCLAAAPGAGIRIPTAAPRLRLPKISVRYFRARVSYGAHTDATRSPGRYTFTPAVSLAGDIELNPGPDPAQPVVSPGVLTAHPGLVAAPSTSQQQRNRPISVISQNVRSLRNKLHTLRSHSTELEAYDVIAMTETWLSSDVADSELQIALPGHLWFRRDRPTNGGGVACAVRALLNPTRRSDLEQDDTETLIVELKTVPAVLVAVCYCKPVPDGGVLDRTMTVLRTATTRHPLHRIIAVGDFNLPDIEWSESTAEPGSARAAVTRTSQRAVSFLDSCMVAGFVQHVHQPTRGDNTLDLVLSNTLVDAVVRPGVFESDHAEVVCLVKNVKSQLPLVNRSSAYNYKRADFAGLRRSLQLLPWSVLDGMVVDEAVDLFYSFFEAAIAEHVPVVTIKRKFPPWFDRELRTALRSKETASRRMKRSGSDAAAAEFCEKRREFKNMSDLRYREYLQSLTNDFKTNPKRLWSFLKSVKGGKAGIHVLFDENGAETMDDVQKANILNSEFASKFTDSRIATLPDICAHDLPMFSGMKCDVNTVRTILSSIPVHKACGPDGISARIIRECIYELSVPLAKIYAMSFNQGTFSQRWKELSPFSKRATPRTPKTTDPFL